MYKVFKFIVAFAVLYGVLWLFASIETMFGNNVAQWSIIIAIIAGVGYWFDKTDKWV